MIKSMTGFGRCEISEGDRKFTVEMKGVNHRYLDMSIRMPKKLNFFETAIRTEIKKRIQRGKVDIFISYEDLSDGQVSLKYNESLAAEYLEYFKQMEEKFGIENDVRVSALSRYPEIFTMEEGSEDTDELWKGLKKALDGAVDGFVTTRTAEGEHLREDILAKLDGILEMVAYEEVVRLKSHVVHMKETLQSDEAGIGRKLDFIAQEMNREANTILSKANDLEVSNTGIGLKTEIEKVREQIQNIE